MIEYKLYRLQIIFVLLTLLTLNHKSFGQDNASDSSNLNVYGDFRIRIEDDFGNQESSGEELEGRTRARIRARLGATYSPYDHVSLGLRVRSGLIEGQQIANITIYDFNVNNRYWSPSLGAHRLVETGKGRS